jgi:hypothetical protein
LKDKQNYEVISTPPPLRGASPHLRGESMVWQAGIYDDSPGGQLLGIIFAIIGIAELIRNKKNFTSIFFRIYYNHK